MMKTNIRLLAGLVLLSVLAAACGGSAAPTPVAQLTAAPTERPAVAPTEPAPAPAPEAWPSEPLFVRPEGAKGPLVAYNMSDGRQLFHLPAGMLSADGKHYFAAIPTGGETLLNQYDLSLGADIPAAKVAGEWELSSVSATGRWAALTRVPGEAEKQARTKADGWKTDVQIVDTQTGQIAHQVNLDGNFEVDTISAQGDALFVIQYLPAVNPDHYQVRLYDLRAGVLQDGALVDKSAPDEVMAGQAWEAVATRDGRWLLTLYLRADHHSPFIHALNTQDKFTLCLDLPAGGSDLEPLKAFTLALAPNGQTMYATNAALGLVVKVSLNDFSVTRAAQFEADASAYSPQTPSRSVVSKDGRAVYFTNGERVWAFDTQSRKVSAYEFSAPINGLGVSSDGKRLYLARPDQSLIVLDAVSGKALSFLPADVASSR